MASIADFLKAAEGYATLGWPVIPLHCVRNKRCSCLRKNCEDTGKHPLTPSGVKDATTDRKQIKEWWDEWPDANVGIATGKQAGIVVIDIDPRNGGKESFERLEKEHGILSPTIESVTGGGGWHIFFAHPGNSIKNRSNVEPGVDVKSDGGYIVAPPSNHVSGESYRWDEQRAPGEINIAPLPSWLCDKIIDPPSSQRKVAPTSHNLLLQRAQQYAAGAEASAEGGRNNSAFSLAGHLRSFVSESGERLVEEEIISLMQIWNQRNVPPLEESDLRKRVRSALRGDGTPRPDKLVLDPPTPGAPKNYDAIVEDDIDSKRIKTSWTMESACRDYISSMGTQAPCVPSGISELDGSIEGVAPGELCIIAARPSHGKTALGLWWLDQAALSGKACLFVSEEMSKRELAKRSLLTISSVGQDDWNGREKDLENAIRDHYLPRAPTYGVESCQSIANVERIVGEHCTTRNVGIVAVDYIQLLSAGGSDRYQDVSEVSMSLKRMAMRHKVPILVMCQLNREIEKRPDHRPLLSDLRESGQIEQDADVILFPQWPYRWDSRAPNQEYIIWCAKRRNGPIKEPQVITSFDPYRQSFGTANMAMSKDRSRDG